MSAFMHYRFGAFELDARQYELRREGAPLRVEPRVLDLLLYLVRNRDRIVSREELLDTLWKEKFIGEAALTRCVMEARKAVAAPGADDPIKTVHRRGYRFVAPVVEEMPAEAPPVTTPEPQPHVLRSRPHVLRRLPFVALAVFAVAAVALYLMKLTASPRSRAPSPTSEAAMLRVSPDLKVTRVTSSGKATDAAISPDGKLVAYTVYDAGLHSIRMRQVATGSDRELVAGTTRDRGSLTFTPDGSYLAYLEHHDPGVWALHRIPVLGGVPVRLIEQIEDSAWSKGKNVSFTPDGRRVAFIRRLSPDRTALFVGDLDRREERQLVTRDGALFRPIWGADGRTLFCHWKVQGYSTEIRLLEVAAQPSAVVREVWAPAAPLFVAQSMLPDRRHLIGVGGRSLSAAAIYLAGYPGMDLRPITQGMAYWRSASVTADGEALVAVRVHENYNLWTAASGSAEGRQLTSDVDAMEGIHGLALTPDGEIVYTSKTNGEHSHVWIASADGRRLRQVTSGDEEDEFWPAVSPSGETIFYGQRETRETRSMRIWRMDLATGRSMQLTSGSWDMWPAVTPDGDWIIYTDGGGKAPFIRRIRASGGAPETIAAGALFAPAVSPDGRLLAGFHEHAIAGTKTLQIVRLRDGAVVERFPVTAGPAKLCVRWTADGRGLIVARPGDAADNLWLYPLGGGEPRQLTEFRSLDIGAFHPLADGRNFVFSRGKTESDVVMIADVLEHRPVTE